MANPWLTLPKRRPYVLKEDKEEIRAWNEEVSGPYRLRLGTVPEPYIGNPKTARVILLNLNPGPTPKDDSWQRRADFRASYRVNLAHGPSKYPFYILDPRFPTTPSGSYWHDLLGLLLDRLCLLHVAKRIAAVEWLPYHSESFGWHEDAEDWLSSQKYAFQMVAEAVKRGKLIVIMRAERRWKQAVPALRHLSSRHLIVLKNPRHPIISPGNMPRGAFERLCRSVGDCR